MTKNVKSFQELIDHGKESGFLTYDEINSGMPDSSFPTEEIDDFFVKLEDLGIQVVNNQGEYDESPAQKNEAKSAAVAVKKPVAEKTYTPTVHEEDIMNPVRMYLSEMAKVALLDRKTEVALAKRIRENEKKT